MNPGFGGAARAIYTFSINIDIVGEQFNLIRTMNNISAFSISLIFLVLAGGCDGSGKSNQRPDKSEIIESIQFIGSRLQTVDLSVTEGLSSWIPSDFKAVGTTWTWHEKLVSVHPTGTGVIVDEDYTIDIRALVYPVVVNDSNITFECKSEKCLKVQKIEINASVASGQAHQEKTNEDRPKNTWYFADSATAARVGVAMNDAFRNLGAKERKY